MSRMPDFYLQPLGTPLYWMNEQSGELPRAVKVFFEIGMGARSALDDSQLSLLIEYVQYFISAPCWEDRGNNGVLVAVREQAYKLMTLADLQTWTETCLVVGLDPW